MGVGKLTVALLCLELRLDDVGVGCLAGGLALLSESVEAGSFSGGTLGYGELAIRRERSVEETDDGGVETATGYLKLGGGDGERGRGAADGVELLGADGLGDNALIDVFVDGVVGDEAGISGDRRVRRARVTRDSGTVQRLRVDELVVEDGVGQQRSAGDGAV